MVWTETWKKDLTVGIAALRTRHWVEAAEVFRSGWPGQRAWAEVPPVVGHSLWGVDKNMRHHGGPWVRSTLRSGTFSAPDDVERALRSWVEEFVRDLGDESRWLDGAHVASEFVGKYSNGRSPDLDLLLVRRVAGVEAPPFAGVIEMDRQWRDPRRKGPFGPLIRKIKPVWNDRSGWYVRESVDGDALMLIVDADDVSTAQLGLLVDMVQRAEDFWVYDTKAFGLFGAEDIRSWWHDSQDSPCERGSDEGEALESMELQLLVAARAPGKRISFAKTMEGMSEGTSKFRPDGLFGDLLVDVPSTCDLEESAAGDAVLLTVNSMDLTSADVESLEGILKHAKTGFRTFETMTMDRFETDDLRQWWNEARGID
ncbi:hypothetical protein [Janibacter terrae]|uniref:hypothetical protein n=1 Tax=Janibacter terrae TaxID=103817 RepID=UPI00146B5F44|nr:hypothetical protein [Janibacter terrae]